LIAQKRRIRNNRKVPASHEKKPRRR